MKIAVLIFDGLTALDAIGPYEVLHRLPGADLFFVAPEAGFITTDEGKLSLRAEHAIADVDNADVLVVPGGKGTRQLESDARVLDWIRRMDANSSWTTSVCTGSLLLGAAGLLRGIEATSHWALLERLKIHGAIPVSERVVRRGKIITAAGVSAGIDMALVLAAELAGETVAKAIQLGIEYDPEPPFDSGSPRSADPEIVALLRSRLTK
jgi:putative intracellular protease/amidase